MHEDQLVNRSNGPLLQHENSMNIRGVSLEQDAIRHQAEKTAKINQSNTSRAAARNLGERRASAHAHLELVYLVTAFVPSLTACFANSPGSSRRTE
ncbi:hypothetical protein EVAR_70164_1, partial [Eumeta japonica]